MLTASGAPYSSYPLRREFVARHPDVYRRAFGLGDADAIVLTDSEPVCKNMVYLHLKDKTKCRTTALALRSESSRALSLNRLPVAGLQPALPAAGQQDLLGVLSSALQLALSGGGGAAGALRPSPSPSPPRGRGSGLADRALQLPPWQPPRGDGPGTEAPRGDGLGNAERLHRQLGQKRVQ